METFVPRAKPFVIPLLLVALLCSLNCSSTSRTDSTYEIRAGYLKVHDCEGDFCEIAEVGPDIDRRLAVGLHVYLHTKVTTQYVHQNQVAAFEVVAPTEPQPEADAKTQSDLAADVLAITPDVFAENLDSGPSVDSSPSPIKKDASTSVSDAKVADAMNGADAATADLRPGLLFPSNSPERTRIDKASVHPDNATWLQVVSSKWDTLVPEFGRWGIPITYRQDGEDPEVPVDIYGGYENHSDVSDPGKLALPLDALVEQGGPDEHILVIYMTGGHPVRLVELYNAYRSGAGYRAENVSIFDLAKIIPQRPWYKTSADAAGLPIAPFLFTRKQIHEAKEDLGHALRFTLGTARIRRAAVGPATHSTPSNPTNSQLPPMGARLRLRADWTVDADNHAYDTDLILASEIGRHEVMVLARTLQRYGLVLADNGGNMYVTGQYDLDWETVQPGIDPESPLGKKMQSSDYVGELLKVFKLRHFEWVSGPSGVGAEWDGKPITPGMCEEVGSKTRLECFED